MRGIRQIISVLATVFVFPAAGLAVLLTDSGPVGVVDHRLVSQENWVKPWKADWDSGRIVGLFETNGIQAEVIGLETLKSLDRLKSYRAIMIPTDECYPDEGSSDGPVSKTIAAFVRSGGIYIMPMGAAHCRWRDVLTGIVSRSPQGFPRDFLGLEWKLGDDRAAPVPTLVPTRDGKKIGVSQAAFKGSSTYARALAQPGMVFVRNTTKQPCLYANAVGSGAVIHYAGGLVLGPDVRDWLVATYAVILKSGPDLKAIRRVRMEHARVYELVPVSLRAKGELSLDGEWELAEAKSDVSTELDDLQGLEWTRIRIPNTIQHALFLAGKIANPWYADNCKNLQWIHQKDWYLRRKFAVPNDWQGRHIRLRFDGMDYVGMVWLDGSFLGSHEGMFGGPTFDVTPLLAAGEHEVVVRLIHETAPQSGPTRVIKSIAIDGNSYQWGNRYRTIGLWRSVRLVATPKAYLEAPLVRTEWIRDGKASLWAQAMINNVGAGGDGTVTARIVDLQTGKVVWRQDVSQSVPAGKSYWEQTIQIKKPKLWWPNGVGNGTQPLYRLELSLARDGEEADSISTRFGIRTFEMVRNPSWPKAPRSKTRAWGGPGPLDAAAMENADESYRFLFVVNGLPLYAKGACWLTSDDLLALTPERESWMFRAARTAGLNLFRLNGGCNIFETEQFYNLADENGILVWQELPFCWHTTAGSTISAWRDQLTQSVLRLRQHPSLAVYVGGNEFNPYAEGVASVVDLFREICDAYDDRPFRMSSPGGGTHHAYLPWDMYSADVNWYGTLYDEGYNFISEWSFPCFGNPSFLERIIPKEELAQKPVGLDWDKFVRTHPIMTDRSSELNFIGRFSFFKGSWYGDLAKAGLREFTEYTQMAQADLYGTVFEQWRSQFPYKGGQAVWLYNTIGPASSWNLIDWFGQPQISYYSTRRAHEPVHVMARMPCRSWAPGNIFHAKVLVLNDGAPDSSARVVARILDREMKPVFLKNWKLKLRAGERNVPPANGDIAWTIPSDTPESYFFLELTLGSSKGKRLSQHVYWQRVLKSLADPETGKKWRAAPVPEQICTNGPWLKPQIAACPTTLALQMDSIRADGPEACVTITVENTGPNPAYPVTLSVSPDTCAVIWSNNYFWLAPGARATLTGTVRLDMRGIDPMSKVQVVEQKDLRVEARAWNVLGKSVGSDAP